MTPTVQNVMDATRSLLADDEVAGGQVYTNAALQPFFATAYSELFRCYENHGAPRGLRTAYYNLPPNTSYLAPQTAGLANFAEPEEVWERAIESYHAVTAATLGDGYVDLQVASHGWAAGSEIAIYGIVGLSDDVNDLWTIDVPNANTIRLNGCVATGAWSSGGVATYATQGWIRVRPEQIFENMPNTPAAQLGRYWWTGQAFRFFPATTRRQLKLYFVISGTAPTSGILPFLDDTLSFLSYRTAGLAAAPKFKQKADDYAAIALGPSLAADGSGGHLWQLINLAVREMSLTPSVRPRYRRKRNVGPYQWSW